MTLYRKVFIKDRLPKPTIGLRKLITEIGILGYSPNKGCGFWFNEDGKNSESPEWFMEEIDFPTEQEVTNHYMSYDGHINNPALFGAKYILNKLKG